MTTLADLLATLRRLHLLEPAQLDRLSRQWTGQNADPRTVTKQLVEQGLLTHFQANQLFKGKGNELLLGSYVLLELLGEGGMGAVYKARNWKLGQIVAVKLIRKERLTNPEAVKRFHREIRAVAKLDHPNIVRAFDADEVRGTHFFVMEFVEGTDLDKLVKTQGPLDVRLACDYVRQAALGLQHAHDCKLVHRDIKPHNLLVADVPGSSRSQESGVRDQGERKRKPAILTPDSRLLTPVVKILDLGLARIEADGEHSTAMTLEGTVMGTPDYIAPEQSLDAHRVDIRTDLYSLGCTLYYLLTGQVPFPGGSLMEKLMRHQQRDATPLRRMRDDIPLEVEALVSKLMAKRPEERCQTPAEVAQALAAILSGSMTTVTSAVTAPMSPLSTASARNPFAEMGSDATLAPTVLGAELIAPPVQPSAAGSRGMKIGLLAVGGLLATVLLIVMARSFFGGAKPAPRPDDSLVFQKPAKKREKSLMEQADAEAIREEQEEKKRQEEAKQRWAQEAVVQAKRAEEAESPFKALEAKFKEKAVTFASFAKELQEFKAKHGGTPAAIRAAEMLMRLPSPLDQLDPAKIPEDAKVAWKAAGFDGEEVVAVLGEHRQRHWGAVNCVAYSPDGKLIASGGDDRVIRMWDAEAMKEKIALKGHSDAIRSLCFSKDGRSLLSAAGADKTVRLWDVETGKELRRFQAQTDVGWVHSVTLSADGKRALSGNGDRTLHLWDVETGKELRSFQGHKSNVQHVAFSPDGRRALSGSTDKTMRLWDVATGMELRHFEAPMDGEECVAFAPDGRRALWAGSGIAHIYVWDVETGKELGRLGYPGAVGTKSVAFSPDGRRAIAAGTDGSVWLWDLESGKELRRLSAHVGQVHSVAFSPDGRRIVSGGSDGTVRLWDVDTGKEVQPLTGHAGLILLYLPVVQI